MARPPPTAPITHRWHDTSAHLSHTNRAGVTQSRERPRRRRPGPVAGPPAAAPRPPRTPRRCTRAPCQPCGLASRAQRPGSGPSRCSAACAWPGRCTPPPRSPRTASAGTSRCRTAGNSPLHSAAARVTSGHSARTAPQRVHRLCPTPLIAPPNDALALCTHTDADT